MIRIVSSRDAARASSTGFRVVDGLAIRQSDTEILADDYDLAELLYNTE